MFWLASSDPNLSQQSLSRCTTGSLLAQRSFAGKSEFVVVQCNFLEPFNCPFSASQPSHTPPGAPIIRHLSNPIILPGNTVKQPVYHMCTWCPTGASSRPSVTCTWCKQSCGRLLNSPHRWRRGALAYLWGIKKQCQRRLNATSQ